MHPSPEKGESPLGDEVAERVESLAGWVVEIDARLSTAELRTGDEKTAKELRRALEAFAKHDPKLESRLTNRVDVLADRLETIASTMSTTAASVAGKEGEIAGLKRGLGEDAARIQSLTLELGRTAGAAEVEEIRAALRSLSAERPRRTGDQRIDELVAKVDYFSERLDTLAKTVATTASGLAGREGDVAALRQRLEETQSRAEQAICELRQLHGESALTERLHGLERSLAQATADLSGPKRDVVALRARIDEAYAQVGSVVSDLQRSIAALSSRAALLEQLPGATEQAFVEHSAALNARIEALGAELVAEVTARQAGAERERDTFAATRSWSEERTRVSAQLETLAAAHASVTQSHESVLGELAGRLDAMERDGEARSKAPSETEVTELRILVDGLRMRLAASEQTLAAVVDSHRAGTRLDELTRRIDSVVEGPGPGIATSADRGPVAGDGRFRLELRTLELRMEHAEATACENREAVLVQLERLASRFDWRLQRLESEQDDRLPEVASGGAQVVPIRGGKV